ncbi:MAG TPA: NAD(P)(+) transhydrogenase (Re/Si-specific) subunit alpha, partial [Chitinophagaceae bacterium]|nr:NAD(P)(+) transhydrogenase (Re/Si-specific) subunit alpha [Chitinophagaceae bacterium]
MKFGICKEPAADNRVSLLPDQAETLIKKQIEIFVESDAGSNAFAADETFVAKGCKIASRTNVLQCDVVFSINPLSDADIALMKPAAVIIGVFQPLFNFGTMKIWAEKKFTTFSLDMIPRTTRAQSMDVLSSQA